MAGDQRGSGYGLGLSTRTQVTGYQFLARRTAMALTRWRVRMEIEPGRRQTLAVVASISAALVICLGALLYSFISPSGQLNDTPIIADRDSGALYVRVGDIVPRAEPGVGQADRRSPGQPAQGSREPDRPAAARAAGGYPRRTVGVFPDHPGDGVVAGVRLGGPEGRSRQRRHR